MLRPVGEGLPQAVRVLRRWGLLRGLVSGFDDAVLMEQPPCAYVEGHDPDRNHYRPGAAAALQCRAEAGLGRGDAAGHDGIGRRKAAWGLAEPAV